VFDGIFLYVEIERRSGFIDPALVSLFKALQARPSQAVVVWEIDLLNIHWGSFHCP
jgi:hypothetical protein